MDRKGERKKCYYYFEQSVNLRLVIDHDREDAMTQLSP